MTTKLQLTLLLLFSTLISIAQTKEEFNKIKSYKVAYFTEELSLSTDEAADFWPIYNKFEEAQIQMWKAMRARAEASQDPKLLSESEAKKQLANYISERTDEHERTMKLYKDLQKILPAKKVLLLPRAEDNFRRKLMRMHRERRNGENQSNSKNKRKDKSPLL